MLRYLLIPLFAISLSAADWYVSPTGIDGGAGTLIDPLSITKAIGDGVLTSPVAAGDTVWIRGGTYYPGTGSGGIFTSRLAGTLGTPVYVKPYPGERPILEATLTNTTCLDIRGSNTWYIGLEMWNSATDRTSSSVKYRGPAITCFAPNTKLLNLIIHDCGQGAGVWDAATGTEVNGCLIYNNGMPGFGHGLYVHSTGLLLKNNVILNTSRTGIHAYSESPYTNMYDLTVEGNAISQSGILGTTAPLNSYENYEIGGVNGIVMTNVNVLRNFGFHSTTSMENMQFGYLAYPNYQGVCSSNYLYGAFSTIGYWTNLVYTYNTNTHLGTYFHYVTDAGATNVTWDYNEFHSPFTLPMVIGSGTDGISWSDWKTTTGFDAHSTMSTSDPTTTVVFIRTNDYFRGKGFAVVYNWQSLDNVSIDPGAFGIRNGYSYTIRDAANYFGPSTMSGTYAGSPVSVPMTNLVVATPVGLSAPPATGPMFNVFMFEEGFGTLAAASVRAGSLRGK